MHVFVGQWSISTFAKFEMYTRNDKISNKVDKTKRNKITLGPVGGGGGLRLPAFMLAQKLLGLDKVNKV